MNKIEITGNITQITKNTYPSGCCLDIVKIITKLFDGTTQNLSVNFFNDEDKKLADIVSTKCKVGDRIKIIAVLKPTQYRSSKNNSVCRVVQLMAKNIMKLPVTE